MKNLWNDIDYVGVLLTPIEADVISKILTQIRYMEGQPMESLSENEQWVVKQLYLDFTNGRAENSTSIGTLKPVDETTNSLGDFLRKALKELPVTKFVKDKNGKKYRKLDREEFIKPGAMYSWNNSKLMPITNFSRETIGNTPSDFSDERDFYNPV